MTFHHQVKNISLPVHVCEKPADLKTRFAKFSLVRHTQTGKNIPNGHKIYQMGTKYSKWAQNIANGHKIYQMGTKYSKWPQNISNGQKI
jgi:hypothetical protein